MEGGIINFIVNANCLKPRILQKSSLTQHAIFHPIGHLIQ